MSKFELPRDIPAENNVLGCFMVDKETLEYLPELREEDFFSEKNKKLFNLIKTMYTEEKEIDPITVDNKFNDIEFVTHVATSIVHTANFEHYYKIVKENSTRRKLIKSAQQVLSKAKDHEYDTETALVSDCLKIMDIETSDSKAEDTTDDSICKVLETMEQQYAGKVRTTCKTGIESLDKVTQGITNNLTILAARPSVGKTTLAINIMVHLVLQNKTVVMFNAEMTKGELFKKMFSILSGIPNSKINNANDMTDADWTKLSQKINVLYNKNLFVYDDIFDVDQIRAKLRKIKKKHDIDCVFVDYLQLIDTTHRTNTRNETVSYVSRRFKMMQKEFKCGFWVLSQLSRPSNKDGHRMPILTDLRDSGSIEQDADSVYFLHDPESGNYEQDTRDYGPSELDIIIAKQRLGQRDLVGRVKFYKNTQRMF